jgi:Tfp pilus assembly protein PilO
LRAEAKAYAAAPVSGDVLLDGTSDTIAGANLQAFLQNLASQAGVSFDDIEALPARQTGALRRIGVSVDMAVPWPEFTAFIAAIEAAPLRMTVDDLSLAAQSQPPAKDAVVKASFSLFAFRAGNAP